jgi:condensin-2 complex subunit H2
MSILVESEKNPSKMGRAFRNRDQPSETAFRNDFIGSNFMGLLRPVRDLAANWDVDVVSSLTDYMAELGMDQTVVDEISSLHVDFKQAALLVEGSTCIYSRKVDYLYSLVFATADMIYEARGKRPPPRRAGGDKSGEETEEAKSSYWEELEFLLLDDLLDKEQAQHGSISITPRGIENGEEFTRTQDANRITTIPLHLLPNGPQTACSHSTLKGVNKAGLRIPQATINSSTGALILDGIGLNLASPPPNDTCQGESRNLIATASHCADIFESDDGDHNNDDGLPCDVEMDAGTFVESDHPRIADDVSTDQLYSAAVSLGNSRQTNGVVTGSSPSLPSQDVFAPLDLYDHMSIPTRPLQRGKTWFCPQSSHEDSSLTVGRQSDPSIQIASLTDIVLGPIVSKEAPKSNRFIYNSFLAKEFRTRIRNLNNARRRVRIPGNEMESNTRFAPTDNTGFVREGPDETPGPDHFYFDGAKCSDETFDLPDDSSSHEADLFDADDTSVLRSPLLETRVDLIAATYEETCRKYLRESSMLWKEHAADSNLERRVCDWRSRIEPLLEAEEKRHSFDIKEYSTKIMTTFRSKTLDSESDLSDMASIFETTEPFEVCRKFLATLQLVNNGSIAIVEGSSEGQQMFNPKLRLLKASVGRDVLTESLERNHSNVLTARLPDSQINPSMHTPPKNTTLATFKRIRQGCSTPESARRVTTKLRISDNR